jgi:C_GCAxxG_C_C family probable redox protein
VTYTPVNTIPTGLPETGSPHARAALSHFQNGCQCAQATLCAFEDLTGLSHDTCMALAASFGGGVSRIRGGCGALSGILMAAGLLLYPSFPAQSAKDDHYRLTQYLAARFKERMRSIYCHELLGLPRAVQPPVSTKRTHDFYTDRPCACAIVAAAEILEDVLRLAREGQLAACLREEACAQTTAFLNCSL